MPQTQPLAATTIFIEHNDLGYDELMDYVAQDVLEQAQHVVLKRDKKRYQLGEEELDIATDTLDTSIANWKDLLSMYIKKKWKDDAPAYLDMLHELGILT